MPVQICAITPFTESQKDRLKAAAPDAQFTFLPMQSLQKEQVQHADIIIGNVPTDWLKDCSNLKWVQLISAGADQYAQPGVLPEGVLLTNASGSYGLSISEYMVGMLLQIYRKLHLYRDNQIGERKWQDAGAVKSIYGSTVLVLGMGDIGGEFAKRVKFMGAYVIGMKRHLTDELPDYVDELWTMEHLDTLLPRADVVAMSLPQTAETIGLMNEARIQLMKEQSVLLNVGRGSAVDTDALCKALESGHILGAGLDVTDPEPLPADHKLWTLPGAVITPHVSGGYYLPETVERIATICIENLKAFTHGDSVKNVVDLKLGY